MKICLATAIHSAVHCELLIMLLLAPDIDLDKCFCPEYDLKSNALDFGDSIGV